LGNLEELECLQNQIVTSGLSGTAVFYTIILVTDKGLLTSFSSFIEALQGSLDREILIGFLGDGHGAVILTPRTMGVLQEHLDMK
jgi:hypothetical protein